MSSHKTFKSSNFLPSHFVTSFSDNEKADSNFPQYIYFLNHPLPPRVINQSPATNTPPCKYPSHLARAETMPAPAPAPTLSAQVPTLLGSTNGFWTEFF